MKQFKVCLLGAPMIGKTSLARRYVHSCFSEEYHSTIGVKIDKKSVVVDGETIQLIIWDVQGEERYRKVLPSYLRGMSGYFMVVDATRPETVDVAVTLQQQIIATQKDVPFVVLRNKIDLVTGESPVPDVPVDGALATLDTSARTGDGVELAFTSLVGGILRKVDQGKAA